MIEFGTPEWTEGQFQRASALDDLGLESVGAGLLRRLIPGVVQTTPNAGYYSFYPYLLAKWRELSKSELRVEFKPFFRRQEVAYALACSLHHHRGGLFGIQGATGAAGALQASGDVISVASLADSYMQSTYGGYGLFYARVLEDMRLTKLGTLKFVDRATESGEKVAEAFGEAFESTRYFQEFFDADLVPREVLADLGERTCLCTIPGREDHKSLLDVFFGEPVEDPVWEDRRRTRVESLALFLEFHRQRPDGVIPDLRNFRIALAQGAFPGGTPLETPFPERQNSWRAYQLRECETLILTTIWTRYLHRLGELDPISPTALRDDLVASADWAEANLSPDSPVADLLATAAERLSSGAEIVDAARSAAADQRDDVSSALAGDLLVLLAIAATADSEDVGFAELRDEGGPGRWSLQHLRSWLDARSDQSGRSALSDLIDALHHQHVRVALSKVSPTDSRDPFCFSDDDGQLRLIRNDEPFWTGARYDVVNHLLWTLGLLDHPAGEIRPTELGLKMLGEVSLGA